MGEKISFFVWITFLTIIRGAYFQLRHTDNYNKFSAFNNILPDFSAEYDTTAIYYHKYFSNCIYAIHSILEIENKFYSSSLFSYIIRNIFMWRTISTAPRCVCVCVRQNFLYMDNFFHIPHIFIYSQKCWCKKIALNNTYFTLVYNNFCNKYQFLR